ncbi:MAG TPA: murein biosynthesis integral membrane protein MurJ [Acidimicrobiales bacterium]|nr:murein biosynthesis integral membrane protein MurJ [Acidimicrobiales bacterium]
MSEPVEETGGQTELSGSGGGRVDLQRATVGMAVGTTVSRLTGVGRILVLAYALGFHHLADAYNLANTTPNMLYDIVLGGVLSATFIPVFIDRLATRSNKEAWRAISAVVTLSLVVLAAATVIFWLLAPLVIDAFTAFGHSSGISPSALAQERSVATNLLRWFVPQVFFYGAISLTTALLNARHRFGVPTWVPVANNLVCIAVLLWFRHVTPDPSLHGALAHGHQLVLLGLGTTAGVALQALLLVPSFARAGLGRVRLHWEPGHEAVRTVIRLGLWTFGFVLANQVALYVVLALAVGAKGGGTVSSYTYAYAFMQMPYAVVAVSVMSAVTPDLSRFWALGDVAAFRRRFAGGLRAVLSIILPAAVGMLLLAKPAVALLLGHGAAKPQQTADAGAALAILAAGLPGFCSFLFVVRALQTMQRTKVAFWLYLVENGINVVLALALVHSMSVRGLAVSLSVAYTLAALLGVVVLRGWLGSLGGRRVWSPLRGSALSTVVMGVAVLVVSNLSGASRGFGLLVRVLVSVAVGGGAYLATAVIMANHDRRVGRRTRMRPPTRPW